MQPRSFIASTGVDTNDGKLATPCRSIGAALAQTNPGGEIIVLDSAGYGAATINKSVAIIAAAGVFAGITVAAGTGIDVTAGVVTLCGLTLVGTGGAIGIHVGNATVRIDRCVISGMAHSAFTPTSRTARFMSGTPRFRTVQRDSGSRAACAFRSIASPRKATGIPGSISSAAPMAARGD
jgi:hypothetical protein